MICVECGKEVDTGSMKHPYCKECFKKIWNDDFKLYMKWIEKTHCGVRKTFIKKLENWLLNKFIFYFGEKYHTHID